MRTSYENGTIIRDTTSRMIRRCIYRIEIVIDEGGIRAYERERAYAVFGFPLNNTRDFQLRNGEGGSRNDLRPRRSYPRESR